MLDILRKNITVLMSTLISRLVGFIFGSKTNNRTQLNEHLNLPKPNFQKSKFRIFTQLFLIKRNAPKNSKPKSGFYR
jgi:hypothetical protein